MVAGTEYSVQSGATPDDNQMLLLTLMLMLHHGALYIITYNTYSTVGPGKKRCPFADTSLASLSQPPICTCGHVEVHIPSK